MDDLATLRRLVGAIETAALACEGAAQSGNVALSELAVYGAKNRGQCRFGARVTRQELARDDVAEIIHCQPEGQRMIEEQPEWRA